MNINFNLVRCTFVTIIAIALACSASQVVGQVDRSIDTRSTSVDAKVTSVGLFKNGLAVVRRTVVLPRAGTFELQHIPEAVHGTFWIESDAHVEARMTSREMDVPVNEAPLTNFQTDLAGQQVRIDFRNPDMRPISGKVVRFDDRRGADAWSRLYEQPSYNYYWGYGGHLANTTPNNTNAGRFLVLESSEGRTYVDTGMIGSVRIADTSATVKRRRPVLMLSSSGADRPGTGRFTVTITYLTKGMAWAPSYQLDITDPKALRLVQKAVIRNELEDLEDVHVELISGFPSIEFGHVLSPLSPRTNWANFFSQLSQRISGPSGLAGNVVQQQMVMSNDPYGGGGIDLDPSAMAMGDGVDLHHHPIGRKTMLEGDALMMTVAEAEAEYERIVEWIVPDTRDRHGRYVEEWQRQQNPQKYVNEAWDALRFKNPLSFPMTTGPAMIVTNGRFDGQRTSYWTNPGEMTTIRITKALSVRTRIGDHEEEGEREIINVGGRTFRKPTVQGELQVCNHRGETITVVIRRRFSGDLIEADESPEITLREDGIDAINPRHEMTWTIELAPGEERTLKYRYSVLVLH